MGDDSEEAVAASKSTVASDVPAKPQSEHSNNGSDQINKKSSNGQSKTEGLDSSGQEVDDEATPKPTWAPSSTVTCDLQTPSDTSQPLEGSLTITGVFKILNINLSREDLDDLLKDFGDDPQGIDEFVVHIENDIGAMLFDDYNDLMRFKDDLLAFCRWYTKCYKQADKSTKPDFTAKTWAAYRNPAPSQVNVSKSGDEVSAITGDRLPREKEDMLPLPRRPHDQGLDRKISFPESARVKELVNRYNRNVEGLVPSLCIKWDDVEVMYKRLKLKCERALVDPLVYAPRDLSVFVRTEHKYGYIVDVALCTQDRTHRSDVHLDGDVANWCSNRVGVEQARMRAPDVATLHPIVQDFVQQRVIETIGTPVENLCIIELARSYNSERMDVRKEVPAGQLWGDHGHGRRKFNFDKSSDDRDLYATWLICMTLFTRETTEEEHEAIRNFLWERYTDFEDRKMTKNVNYETMFRSKGPEYRSGRLSWPLMLGLCLAKNLKEELKPLQRVSEDLQDKMGTYCGMFTDEHFLCGGLAVALAALLFIVAAFAVTVWNLALLRLAATLLIPGVVLVITANFYYLGDARPLAFLVPTDRRAPTLKEKDRGVAVRLLFSESSRRHFNGENLSFTGESYTGTKKTFGYRFTYEDLRELGFGFYCDSWGREHLRVPRTGVLVRMDRSRGDVDYFVRVEKEEEPKLLFEKPWYSTTSYPG